MKLLAATALLCLATALVAQTPAATPFPTLAFLQGTWLAQTQTAQPQATAPSNVTGTYTFAPELDGHILARHAHTANCSAPNPFDCDHGDLLYIYQDAPGQPFRAIYFDNEGHVLHYLVTTPTPTTAVFLTDPAQPGPQFRLLYELHGATMSGKFQIHPPDQPDWHSYLEWSGTRQ